MVDENISRNIKKVKNLSYIRVDGQTYTGSDVADFNEMVDNNAVRYGIMVLLTDGTLHYHYNTSFIVGYKNQNSLIPNEK